MHLDDHVLGLLDAEKPYIELTGWSADALADREWPYSSELRQLATIFEDYAAAHPGAGVDLRFVGADLVDEKHYLILGSRLVLEIHPRGVLKAIDDAGSHVFTKSDVFVHAALPGLRIELEPFFARVNR